MIVEFWSELENRSELLLENETETRQCTNHKYFNFIVV